MAAALEENAARVRVSVNVCPISHNIQNNIERSFR